ncbi:hypothetical protein N7522_003654 [Penicillium canescens]|nr:hypothetical protein N7522_003654 [Penicillium canescens]
MTQDHIAKVLGEAKVPWNPEHDLGGLVRKFETRGTGEPFRHALGPYFQIAQYMLELKLKYRFLTTYEQTICLRKVDI